MVMPLQYPVPLSPYGSAYFLPDNTGDISQALPYNPNSLSQIPGFNSDIAPVGLGGMRGTSATQYGDGLMERAARLNAIRGGPPMNSDVVFDNGNGKAVQLGGGSSAPVGLSIAYNLNGTRAGYADPLDPVARARARAQAAGLAEDGIIDQSPLASRANSNAPSFDPTNGGATPKYINTSKAPSNGENAPFEAADISLGINPDYTANIQAHNDAVNAGTARLPSAAYRSANGLSSKIDPRLTSLIVARRDELKDQYKASIDQAKTLEKDPNATDIQKQQAANLRLRAQRVRHDGVTQLATLAGAGITPNDVDPDVQNDGTVGAAPQASAAPQFTDEQGAIDSLTKNGVPADRAKQIVSQYQTVQKAKATTPNVVSGAITRAPMLPATGGIAANLPASTVPAKPLMGPDGLPLNSPYSSSHRMSAMDQYLLLGLDSPLDYRSWGGRYRPAGQ
jgi:hypothetical protein